MSVANGQVANAVTYNNAFVSRTINTDLAGKFDLKNIDAESGPVITNVQRNINALCSAMGISPNQIKDYLIMWDDGTQSSIITKINQLLGGIQKDFTLSNNISTATNIVGLAVDASFEKSCFYQLEIERIAGGVEYRQVIDIKAIYLGGVWSLTFGLYAGSELNQPAITLPEEVVLSITSVGQWQYKSGNLVSHTSTKIKVVQQNKVKI